MTTHRPRRALAVAAVLAAGLFLSGCSTPPQAGAAAIVGDSRITQQQLATEVQQILEAQRQPVDSPNEALSQKTLSRMITIELVDQLAAQNGVVISQGDIDETLSSYDQQVGSREQVESVFAEQDVAPQQIQTLVRMNLQAQALGVKLDPHGSAEQQGKAVFDAAAVMSDELDVTTSPRFGTWNALALSIDPGNPLTAPPAAAK
jgi:outer membrane murein-binding lipoprotein Lpp